jgi:H(+)-transporting ATP synthase, vacuolar type, subunit D
MEMKLFPTKGNLILAKNTLALCRQGYELLDKKRNILVREMMNLVDKARGIQKEMLDTFQEAYRALQLANVTMGISTVEQIGYAVPEESSIEIREQSIMGVEIPRVTIRESEILPRYGFRMTNSTLDAAMEKFEKAKHLAAELAEIENAVYRLATNIRKTQKRTNALKNIMIPRYEEATRNIVNALEEKEREEFSRLKVIKRITRGE